MPYATVEDMVEAFGEREIRQLSNPSNPAAQEINQAEVEAKIRRAQALVDGYLVGRAPALPLSPVPELIKGLVLDLARYYLDRVQPRETVTDRHNQALKQLMAIREGKLDLGLTPEPNAQPIAPSEDAGPLIDSPAPLFTDGTLSGYLEPEPWI